MTSPDGEESGQGRSVSPFPARLAEPLPRQKASVLVT